MNIGIDISQTAYEGTGVARYTTALAMALLKHTDNRYTFLFNSLRKNPPPALAKAIKKPHVLRHYLLPPTLSSFLWNTLHTFAVENLVGDVDIFVSSDWTQPPTSKAKKVTIVHDLVPYVFPETATSDTTFHASKLTITPNIVATHKKRLAWVKRECDFIIADSKSTKQDLINILDIAPAKIEVIYPSVYTQQPSEQELNESRALYGLNRPFILTVGTIQPRKNIGRLIQAFCEAKLYTRMDLVIVGGKGWGDTAVTIPREAQKAILFLGYVSDAALFSLYAQAHMFVMPSLYEGFGYPVIEAMAMGCPVAASKTSSLGELTEGYGTTFDPKNVTSIKKALLELATDKDRKKLIAKARSYAQSFTPERFGHDFAHVLNHL